MGESVVCVGYYIEMIDFGVEGIFYCLMVGLFLDKFNVISMCNWLKFLGYYCVI